MGSRFIVVIDNVVNTFFTSQTKLSAKRARWQEFLEDFNFEGLHRPRKNNVVADTLSPKEVIAYIYALLEVVSYFNGRIKQIARSDVKDPDPD